MGCSFGTHRFLEEREMKTVTMFVAGLGLALASSAQAGALFSVLDNQKDRKSVV